MHTTQKTLKKLRAAGLDENLKYILIMMTQMFSVTFQAVKVNHVASYPVTLALPCHIFVLLM